MFSSILEMISSTVTELIVYVPEATVTIIEAVIGIMILYQIPWLKNFINGKIKSCIDNSSIIEDSINDKINNHAQLVTKEDMVIINQSLEKLSNEIRIVNKNSVENINMLKGTLTEHRTSLKELIALNKSIHSELKINSTGTKDLIRDKLCYSIGVALKRGVTTEREFRVITELYNSYVSLGGNGEVATMYAKYEKIERISEYELARSMVEKEQKNDK